MDGMDATPQARTGNSLVTVNETAAAPMTPHGPLDIVYVVRPGDENESLRYSLRSLINLPHRHVWLAGARPSWAKNVGWVQKNVDQELPDQEDSNLNLYLALRDIPGLSEDFIFMNDDFFIMKPTTVLEDMYQGTLEARIMAYKAANRFHQAYSLIKTQQELERLGYGPELLSYELHMPMIFNRTKLLALFGGWREPLFALRPRTMYGNMYKVKGVAVSDAKDSINPEERFLSTGVDFDISRAGELVRARFPRPGAYEQEHDAGRIIQPDRPRRDTIHQNERVRGLQQS